MADSFRAAPDEPLPGLGAEPTDAAVGELERQVRRSLARMQLDGLVDERHAGLMQLALELCRAITRGASSGRASAVAMAAKELREVFAQLMPDEEVSGGDDFDRWKRELAGMDPAGGSA